jgi:hypothetical protein
VGLLKIKFLAEEEHRLKIDTFSEVINWALVEVKEFKKS